MRKALLPALACAISFAPPLVHAQELPHIAFEKYQLANGLEVILSQDHRLPLVAVNIWYHVGPANEEAGRTGFAHLFEHMMFQGSRDVKANEHFRYLEGAGSSEYNGTTDFDRTNYFETVPSDQLALALWLESDRMGYLIDKLDQKNLSTQQDVVRNERRQSLENVPYGIVEEAMYHRLFPATHPYYAEVIGSHADIQAAKLEDVRRFFKQYYVPNNATLTIVGDFDPASTKQLVEKYFGPLARGPAVPRITATTPPLKSEQRLTVSDQVELPRVYIGWLTPPIYKPGDAEAGLTAQILAGDKSSRLYKSLVYDKQIAQDVTINAQSELLGSIFELYATAKPGHTAAELENAINLELDRFRTEGPTATELERARNTIETNVIRGLERLNGFGGVADRLNQYNHYLGNPDYLERDIQRFRDATPASIKTFAQQQLTNDKRVVVYGVPGKRDLGAEIPNTHPTVEAASESINPPAKWRESPPARGAERPFKIPVPASFTLANGLQVIYDERPGLPVVAANLVFRTGDDASPIDKPGVGDFAVAMLDKGTTSRSAAEIADEAARLGATLQTGSTMDQSSVTVRSLTSNFPAALHLAADVALHPAFSDEEIARLKTSRLGDLANLRQDPSSIAPQVLAMSLYGPRHPYGYAALGTEASIKATTRADLVSFWKNAFVPNNAALVVVGKIDPTELRNLAEREFGSWSRGAPVATRLGGVATTDAKIVVVNLPDAPQTQLRVGLIGPPRSTPDYDALELMNTDLGGMFSSRINLNLREAHGYTYGAWSYFDYRRAGGPFMVVSGVRADVTGASVSEIMKELNRMRSAPMPPEELKLSKDSYIRSLPGNFESSGRAANNYSSAYIYGLGLDYFSKLPGRFGALTSSDALDVARRYLQMDRVRVIAVGDAAKIEPQLAALNLGPIEHRDLDGNLIPPRK
ncbi:MAG TPA: pitrilysin family protein [Gemmatimonadaceae bacterium]|nr:pitrilysin family protein [Gemmatimonadaceae bacterium]